MFFYIGFFIGYEAITLWLGTEKTIIAIEQINNKDFLSRGCDSIDNLCKKANISSADISCIGLYTGPSPLTTTRSVCAFIQGWKDASQDKLIVYTYGGMDYLYNSLEKTSKKTVLILQAYAGRLYYYDGSTEKMSAHNSIIEEAKDALTVYYGPMVTISEISHAQPLPDYNPDYMASCIISDHQNKRLSAKNDSIVPHTFNKEIV